MRYLASCLTAVGLWTAASSLASAQPADAFYTGKQIGLYVGFAAGETYDLYARVAATYMPRYIPGHPTFVPYNMPGVGGLKVANFLAQQAPKDGTAIGMSTQSLALEQALKNPAVQYDVRTLNWIGRMAPIIQFVVASQDAKVKTFDDVKRREVILSATSPSGMTYVIPQVLNRLAGARFKIISGYNGSSGALLALERGEVQAATMTFTNLFVEKPEWLSSGKVIPLISNIDRRYNRLPNVPSLVEVGLTAEDRKILLLYSSVATLGRSLAAPPGVPKDRVEILRTAFDKMAADPEVRQEFRKRNLLEFDPLSGGALQSLIADTLDIPADALVKAAEVRQ
ncbi:MAG TPA: tripartite tricarboxylate transporter substrate-binding protein [Alphaproteobacteria bacterium]|nr:tripartite tricarboxylate transporter substrate-binding protein [Alphaproteobacteria bacterium]